MSNKPLTVELALAFFVGLCWGAFLFAGMHKYNPHPCTLDLAAPAVETPQGQSVIISMYRRA